MAKHITRGRLVRNSVPPDQRAPYVAPNVRPASNPPPVDKINVPMSYGAALAGANGIKTEIWKVEHLLTRIDVSDDDKAMARAYLAQLMEVMHSLEAAASREKARAHDRLRQLMTGASNG